MSGVKSLVMTGDGLNCERETARALRLAGSQTDIMHINDLLCTQESLLGHHILAIPGGFSFGDEINSGKILALKIRHKLMSNLERFIQQGGLIIGICNGFQALVKLGLLPNLQKTLTVSLTHNENRRFIDRWVELRVDQTSQCLWTKNLPTQVFFPVRHGEGRVVIKQNDDEVLEALKAKGQIPLRYADNINGSLDQIAGLCDPSGRVFGLMPHPEAAIDTILNPFCEKKIKEDFGLEIFKNAVEYCQMERAR